MEAISPTFAGSKSNAKECRAARTGPAPGLAGFKAASVRLPLCFVLVGIISLLTGAGILVAQPELLANYHYTPHLIAITHLFVLGFISSIVMGAMYQLVPVTLQVQLHSDRLVVCQLAMHVVGFIGMVWSFWNYSMVAVGWFGAVLTCGVGFFIYNLCRTLARAIKWNSIKLGIASSLLWLALTMLAGLLLVVAKFWAISSFMPLAAMHAHAHLGGVGVFVLLIVAVSYKLVPMFTLSELQSERRAWWSVVFLNVGIVAVCVTILSQSPWRLASALLLVAALTLYGWEILAIIRSRNRRALDWGMIYFLTAIGLLIPLSALALILCWSGLPVTAFSLQLESVYGLLALLGLVGLAVLGMLYKIVPFLVWFHSYSRQIGRMKVPALGEMYWVPLQVAGYWTYLGGLIALAVATALSQPGSVRWAGGLFALSLILFAANMACVLAHFIRPMLTPLPAKNNLPKRTL